MSSIDQTVDAASITRIHALHHTIEIDYNGTQFAKWVGWAQPGSAQSSPVWRICQINYDGSNNPLEILWANGNNLYTNAWTGHAGYSYS